MSVPANDVCEDPAGATLIDTSTFANFDIFEDPGVDGCYWSIAGAGKVIYQQSNANSGNTLVLGCNAIIKGGTYTNFIFQADILNVDNDAIGLQFGWKSLDDHFRIYKMNDRWPNPSYDNLPGPIFKVHRKIPGVPCNATVSYTAETSCYQIMSWIDESGPFYDGLALGAVVPFEYSNVYTPFNQGPAELQSGEYNRRMVIIVKDNVLRAYFEDSDKQKVVGIFAYDLAKYDYSGGQIGLWMAGHQAGYTNMQVAPLDGANAATSFCEGRNWGCNPRNGLCLP